QLMAASNNLPRVAEANINAASARGDIAARGRPATFIPPVSTQTTEATHSLPSRASNIRHSRTVSIATTTYDGGRGRCPYQIDFSVQTLGKQVSSTKRTIHFRFGFANSVAMSQGRAGVDCRGEEHDLTVVWSITGGKRAIQMDGIEVQYQAGKRANSQRRADMLEASWRVRDHVYDLLCYAYKPAAGSPEKRNPNWRQYDLKIDGRPFFDLPQIYDLGLKGLGRAAAEPVSVPTSDTPTNNINGVLRRSSFSSNDGSLGDLSYHSKNSIKSRITQQRKMMKEQKRLKEQMQAQQRQVFGRMQHQPKFTTQQGALDSSANSSAPSEPENSPNWHESRRQESNMEGFSVQSPSPSELNDARRSITEDTRVMQSSCEDLDISCSSRSGMSGGVNVPDPKEMADARNRMLDESTRTGLSSQRTAPPVENQLVQYRRVEQAKQTIQRNRLLIANGEFNKPRQPVSRELQGISEDKPLVSKERPSTANENRLVYKQPEFRAKFPQISNISSDVIASSHPSAPNRIHASTGTETQRRLTSVSEATPNAENLHPVRQIVAEDSGNRGSTFSGLTALSHVKNVDVLAPTRMSTLSGQTTPSQLGDIGGSSRDTIISALTTPKSPHQPNITSSQLSSQLPPTLEEINGSFSAPSALVPVAHPMVPVERGMQEMSLVPAKPNLQPPKSGGNLGFNKFGYF
ncbi:hypothetical protein THAOC_27654, partial [Thalassiosira oceanica]